MCFQLEGEYGKAIVSYQNFINNAKNKVKEEYKVLTKKFIQECNYASEAVLKEQRIWVDNLDINS